METNICIKCGAKKNIDEFYFLKKQNKYENRCIECRNKYNQEWSKKNKTKRQEYRKKYLAENKEEIYVKKKEYRDQHKKEISEYNKEYAKTNKEKIQKRRKERDKENIDKLREYRKKYNEEHFDEISKKRKQYYQNNKEKENQRNTLYYKERKKVDKIFKLKVQMRNLIYDSFKRNETKKNKNAEEILGCKAAFFIEYLLQTFKNNYGYEWDGIENVHIDHIKPLKSCNTEEEIIECCHYTNLQLLKAEDNLEKRDSLDWNMHS